MAITIITITPHCGGWEVFEAPGVEPYFGEREQALDYATERARMRTGEIRIFDPERELQETIPFDDSARKL